MRAGGAWREGAFSASDWLLCYFSSGSRLWLEALYLVYLSNFHTFTDRSQDLILLKKSIIKTIINYACLLPSEAIPPMQERALEALVSSDFDYTIESDFELVLAILDTFRHSKYKFFSDGILESLFNLFQKMCEARYHCYFSVVKILNLFYSIFPIVATTAQLLEIKRQFVMLLEIFYKKRDDYGPELLVLLLNCMGLVFEVEFTVFFLC